MPKKDKCVKCVHFEGQKPEDCVDLQDNFDEKEGIKEAVRMSLTIRKRKPSILCTFTSRSSQCGSWQ